MKEERQNQKYRKMFLIEEICPEFSVLKRLIGRKIVKTYGETMTISVINQRDKEINAFYL